MGHHDKEYVYLFMCYRDRNVSFTFCGTLLALEYNGMTLYDIILSPQSSVLNRIGNFFIKPLKERIIFFIGLFRKNKVVRIFANIKIRRLWNPRNIHWNKSR